VAELEYKVVETSSVTDEVLEKIINETVARGWSFDGMQFAMRDSSKRPSRKLQPRWTWRIRLCALYCVQIPMRRMPELTQLESVKSMMRNLPPKNTAGLARRSVSCFSRLPRPPARTSAIVRRASRCWTRADESMGSPR
jgi:hypothetical protein